MPSNIHNNKFFDFHKYFLKDFIGVFSKEKSFLRFQMFADLLMALQKGPFSAFFNNLKGFAHQPFIDKESKKIVEQLLTLSEDDVYKQYNNYMDYINLNNPREATETDFIINLQVRFKIRKINPLFSFDPQKVEEVEVRTGFKEAKRLVAEQEVEEFSKKSATENLKKIDEKIKQAENVIKQPLINPTPKRVAERDMTVYWVKPQVKKMPSLQSLWNSFADGVPGYKISEFLKVAMQQKKSYFFNRAKSELSDVDFLIKKIDCVVKNEKHGNPIVLAKCITRILQQWEKEYKESDNKTARDTQLRQAVDLVLHEISPLAEKKSHDQVLSNWRKYFDQTVDNTVEKDYSKEVENIMREVDKIKPEVRQKVANARSDTQEVDQLLVLSERNSINMDT